MKSTASESRQQDSLRYLGKLQFSDYPRLMAGLRDLPEGHRRPLLRAMCRIDLYFLLRYVMNRQDLQDPWLFARCREVQEEPDGRLDLWARGHYKSTIITFAKTIQDILASHGEDPIPDWGGMQPTFAIFSHTRPTAKAFLRQIKQELEFNRVLMELFPDILYAKPQSQAPKWSEDDGIVVRRLSNPKESTVEAWGLVDGQPTGRHFNVMTYDDVVVKESVTTPDMIKKTTDAMRLSFNLGDREPRKRFIGTRYHFADTYHTVMKERIAKPRIHPATDNGELDGTPVFLTPPQLEAKVREMGPYIAAAQLMQNPIADSRQVIKREWIRHFKNPKPEDWRGANIALLIDPANEKKKSNDFTAMAVVCRHRDRNLYLLDAVRDRLTLGERIKLAVELHQKWLPGWVGWEKYGKDADIDALRDYQDRINYHFHVTDVGGPLGKIDRINRLLPMFADARIWLPIALWRTIHTGETVDVVATLIEEEILPWPVPVHEDLLDAISRIEDLSVPWPGPAEPERKRDRYSDRGEKGSWMSR